ncbi:hypothetical protein OS493_018420 [Desmophyllum pertusum]|uniref:UvrD-like helicase C-terminal domain-containing protein n=1 Tax=Desmophyllum pertusum TaxID=174260 RepID=A0A9X0D8M0_9CNID|nr:hypothetical protein OS493_018420 [Desmophyllum pertusum]
MKIDFGSLKTAKLSHAWARTIHTFQGSEIDTVVYMVGLPYYQNWQHVYTAVTRGVRQVIMINNPSSLWKSIKSLPVRRQTKLEKDMEQAMKNRRHPDAHDEGLKTTNTQFATQSGVVHMNAFASVQPFDSVPDVDGKDEALTSETSSSEHGRHLDAAASSGDFLISRQNLRIKKLKPDQDEHRGLAASSRNGTSYHGIDTQPYQELMPHGCFGTPSTRPQKKHSKLLPPNNRLTTYQQGRHWLRSMTACAEFCQDRIRSGTDTITYDRKGSNKYWIHEGCATSDQL